MRKPHLLLALSPTCVCARAQFWLSLLGFKPIKIQPQPLSPILLRRPGSIVMLHGDLVTADEIHERCVRAHCEAMKDPPVAAWSICLLVMIWVASDAARGQ